MKKIIYSMMIAAAGLMITSCEDFTDIQPKGENLLGSTNDLELLLNTENSLSSEAISSTTTVLFLPCSLLTTSHALHFFTATSKTRPVLIQLQTLPAATVSMKPAII